MKRAKTTAVLGLTGGIASGKSTVGQYFRDWGAEIIDADALAREIVEPGEPAYEALVRAFGEGILQADGTLDRKALGDRVFGDKAALSLLNRLTHPAILAKTGKSLADAQRRAVPWVVYEAALIVENNYHAGLADLIVVSTPPETQQERLMARDALNVEEAQARIASQADDATRRAQARWIIENDSDKATLERRAREVFDAIVAIHGPPAP